MDILRVAAGGMLAAWSAASVAQTFPAKPIRIVVPFTPGAFNDTLGRTLAQRFTETWGHQSLVENRPGGGTLIGSELVAKAPPDGYTLLVVAFPFAVLPSLYGKLPFDPAKDLQAVAYCAATANLLVVNPSVPARNVRELVALAKARPGQINYSTSGNGSSNHIAAELLGSLAGVKMTHIPYKGNVPAITDLIGGQVALSFSNVPNVLPHARAGRLRALAVTSASRTQLAPDIPTVAESGVPGYELLVWFGVVAPAAVPREIVGRLNAEVNRILQLPDVRERFLAQGVEPVGGTADAFGAHIRSEIARWGKVVREAGVKPE